MNLTKSRVLVTGGAGFISSFVVESLVEHGASVTVLDNLSTGRLGNLKLVKDHIQFCEGDMRDACLLARLVRDQDIIFHFAANADVPKSVTDPTYDFHTNAVGAFNLLHGCLNSKVQRIIYASTAAVYGPPQYAPVDESHPCHPISPYGASKLATEILGFAYRHTFDLPFTVVRIFNTYGPRQPRYVIHDLYRKLQKNPNTLEVLGTGDQIRDYCYVTDTARAFLAIASDDSTQGEVYNISGGRTISIRDLVTMILNVTGHRDTIVTYTGKSWPGDIVRLEGEISKIRGSGFSPTIPLEEGLQLFTDWIAKN